MLKRTTFIYTSCFNFDLKATLVDNGRHQNSCFKKYSIHLVYQDHLKYLRAKHIVQALQLIRAHYNLQND